MKLLHTPPPSFRLGVNCKVIHNTIGTTEIKACGERASTLRETLMEVVSMKQEAPLFRWE